MEWLVNKLYTFVKGATAVVLVGVSVALFAGVCGNPGGFIMGAIVVAGAGFLAFDTGAIAKELNRLHKENDQFVANNSKFRDENITMQTNNTNLTLNCVAYQQQIVLLVKVKTDFETAIEVERKTSDDLKSSVDRLSGEITQQDRQIESLRIVQNQAKQLIASLMTAGDDFKDFGSTIMASVDRIDNISAAMGVLLEKLTDGKFMEIDANNDGFITHDELKSWANIRK